MAAKHPAADPGHNPHRSFRYRFPLELSAEESELLDNTSRSFQTKRAALVAGLAALAHLNTHTCQLDQARADATALRKELAAAKQQLEQTNAATADAAKKSAASERKRTAAQARIASDLKTALAALDQERNARLKLETELADLADLADERVDAIPCPRCRTWAQPDQWETEPIDGGELVYHAPCGLHHGGILDPPTILAIRRDS